MELTIVDESDTGADIGDIHAREYVECLSPPHGIDGRYLCIGKTTDYLNPAGNTITIGDDCLKDYGDLCVLDAAPFPCQPDTKCDNGNLHYHLHDLQRRHEHRF